MNDLDSFAKRIRVRGETIEKNANKLVRTVALAVDRDIVLSTPVDTGRARSNWIVSTIAATSEPIEPYAPGEKGSTGAANAQAAIDQAAAEISTHKDGESIFISNNLEYIGDLNDGTSAQAPKGFVEIAIGTGVQVIKGAKIVGN